MSAKSAAPAADGEVLAALGGSLREVPTVSHKPLFIHVALTVLALIWSNLSVRIYATPMGGDLGDQSLARQLTRVLDRARLPAAIRPTTIGENSVYEEASDAFAYHSSADGRRGVERTHIFRLGSSLQVHETRSATLHSCE